MANGRSLHMRSVAAERPAASGMSGGAIPGTGRGARELLLARLKQGQQELVEGLLERGTRLCAPYDGINRILNEKPRVITLDEILDIFIGHALQNGKEARYIENGMKRIAQAYQFAAEAFEGKTRKDGETPLLAHSTRLAAMIAYLGAGASVISSMLLHDVCEDCGTRLGQVEQRFGHRVARYVALLTKPLLLKEELFGRWVHLFSEPELWERMRADGSNAFGEERYQERLSLHFAEILNTRRRTATPEMKATAYLAKAIDATDSLVTDEHLRPERAAIRRLVLLTHLPRIKKLAPGLYGILKERLEALGFAIPGTLLSKGNGAMVIELPPLTRKNFNLAYVDRLPEPNGSLLVYSVDAQLLRNLKVGRNKDRIRIELPHGAPASSLEMLEEHFAGKIRVRFEKGKSALPSATDGAGSIFWVSGIETLAGYNRFKAALEGFHDVLHGRMEGKVYTGRR